MNWDKARTIIAKAAAKAGEPETAPMLPLLQAGLLGRGFNLRPWHWNDTVREHWCDFRFGTCHGLLGMGRNGDRLILLAVVNDQPGNGDFNRLMEALEYAVAPFELILAIGPFWNDRLKQHLLLKRGFVLAGEMVEKVVRGHERNSAPSGDTSPPRGDEA